jgi:peptide-methionine (S)-S-oxide reductase
MAKRRKEKNLMERELATIGGGCFWCLEAVFQQPPGILSILSGYTGGELTNPSYEQVCSGRTGHAEVIQLEFDRQVITFGQLLEIFFGVHDPTTLNRQGNDTGTQYRSAIFFHNEEQQQIASQVIQQLGESGAWQDPIVTELSPLDVFYPAEEYHHDYFRRNPEQGYCQAVVRPKVEKFRQAFADLFKADPPTAGNTGST